MNTYTLSNELDREKMMDDFIKHDCVACGGNWSAMIISGMKYSNKFWWLYNELEDDRSYTFFELVDMVYRAIDERIRSNIDNNNKYLRENIAYRMLQSGNVIGHYNRSNAYVGCDEYVVEYIGQVWSLQFVDGVLCNMSKSTREHGIELQHKTELRRYE